ncbi:MULTISPECIES: recombination mediator RecR [Donghicola]|jgi:recombination protein RecR|uniref:Recombination protein RecR n=1 Tax=Donghicola eburneus TaxID=393278 RepID=A0A1M4N6V8_9RHOB|nr:MULTISPECIES: recombination mediator RecR [Donghicola]MCT4576991.1 recombination mediator RecR [Donghicola sp.]SCM69787.1 Recombination protein RecR [Donghicola eburneus]SFQ64618.1 DNA replication and repair protein RecR [Donghicola eburneus]
MSSTRDIDKLIEMMARLPGLGPRSARRAVLQMIRKRGQLLSPLAEQMAKVAATARECLNCGNIGTEDICDICRSEKRATGEICVVQDVSDLWAMERGAVFGGRYHVLGGTLSALDDIGPEDIRIPQLVARIENEQISEVILALNATVDGQTTAHYIADQLDGRVRITSLAQGVPIGGELDYLDDGTISAALKARRSI